MEHWYSPIICRSRGFAFIVFKELAGIEAALAQTAHVVKGKKVNKKDFSIHTFVYLENLWTYGNTTTVAACNCFKLTAPGDLQES